MPVPSVSRSVFGIAPTGEPISRWILDSGSGLQAEVLDLGAILHRLAVPDTHGRTGNVVLSLPTLTDYLGDHPYIGAVVGRYANRIHRGRFTLDGTVHQVPVNDRGNALHGGPEGFHQRIWRATPVEGPDAAGLRLELHSPAGDMGFPGALDVTVHYTLHPHGALAVRYSATTDQATPVNLTHHAYFNLAGAGSGDILSHRLLLNADGYLPTDDDAIPLGPVEPTACTPFDFTAPRRIGERITDDDPQLRIAHGYDHCWVLTPPSWPGRLRQAARLEAPRGIRRMEVWTTEPGIQIYTGNFLDGSLPGPTGPHERHAGVCLETQHFPDSPNRPQYPSTLLRPEAVHHSTTEYRFTHL